MALMAVKRRKPSSTEGENTTLMAKFLGEGTRTFSTGVKLYHDYISKEQAVELMEYFSSLSVHPLVPKNGFAVHASTRELCGVFVTQPNLCLYNDFLDRECAEFKTSPFNNPTLLQPMHAFHNRLFALCDTIYKDTGTRVNHLVVQRYHANSQSHHNAHSDKTQSWVQGASFCVLSLGHSRTFRIGNRTGPGLFAASEVKDQIVLHSRSLLEVPFTTNDKYKHDVPHQNNDSTQPRYSIVFRQMRSTQNLA